MLFLFLIITSSAWAQITDASFFPSVKSINPGITHLRHANFVALDVGKKVIEKKHDVPLGGIVGGINTDVELSKSTLFAAARPGRWINFELLADKEDGTRTEDIKNPTRGDRTTKNDASSSYIGGSFDFRFFGISYSTAKFDYLNKFRVGEAPDLTAYDEDKQLTYGNLKLGIAGKISFLRVGAYVLNQKSSGDLTYTYYDPTTGNKGSSEKHNLSTSAKGYGAGLGFTLPRLRSEITYESMYDNELSLSDDYPKDVQDPTDASRLTFVGEAKISFIAVGIRYRQIRGNFTDLEDLISSNLLYDTMGEDDKRTEMSFNFSLGNSKGFSPSAFYTQSEVTNKELSPVFDNGLKYKAVTKSKAYGVNLSYLF